MKIEDDGITYINIYSKAKTELGKFLSNFYECDIKTEDGEFKSIEGYWFWLTCIPNSETDLLKKLSGNAAKKLGTNLKKIYPANFDTETNEIFQDKIKLAIRYKIENSSYKNEFIESTLPFEHYYVMYGKVVKPKQHQWVIKFIEEYRKELKWQETF